MEHFLGDGWIVQPAGGTSGEAYIAQQGEQTVFLKRNSSPFLAVLSAEGIVPKLLWTRRLENGDVVTAQRWVEGRELKAREMKERRVALLLAKIHRSNELLEMFRRIGNKTLTPSVIVQDLSTKIKGSHIDSEVIEEGLHFLTKKMHDVYYEHTTVCHSDLNHNNWIVDEHEQLFLIDWDGAVLSDPALDLGILLYSYIPEEEWELWLAQYGVSLEDSLLKRMYWYVISQSITIYLWHYNRHEFEQMKKVETDLAVLLKRKENLPLGK